MTSWRSLREPLACVFLAAASGAQAGDVEGEEQPPLPPDLAVPAAPVLSPEEALESFVVEPGLSVELVAAEPLVEDPVAMAFDGEGRLWVCEMRGFMPNADGTGEDAPVGEVAFLTDTDGDGRMDERTTFLDGLVLPRAIAPCEDGVLVIAPPELYLARDTDGDGRADEREGIDAGLGGIASPEHAINGLLYGHDNWYRCANAPVRYRRIDGGWTRGRTAGGGQWGITKDDRGRIFFDTNSDPLRGDLYPSHYAIRNPSHGRAAGVNVRLAQDMAVWPVRITPGVNRGYQPGTLRDDFTLARFTAACAPHVYRGDALGETHRGDAFVCEPAGNLVKRYRIEEGQDIRLVAHPAYEGREFLASTDERFRPVNLAGGPDGALYVVDMYRGILQHRIFVTSFLRRQIDERGLAEPLGLGRIWRVVRADATPTPPRAPLADASWTELVARLSHPNGFWRDTAQRVIVEEGRGSTDANELLRDAVRGADSPLGRMHALWALEGIGGLTEELVLAGLQDADARVRQATVRVSEPWLGAGSDDVLAAVAALGADADGLLRHQVLLSLGEAETPAADALLAELLAADARTIERRSAVLSGLGDRELAFLERILADESWSTLGPGRSQFLRALARAIVREGRGDRVARLLGHVAACELLWQRGALIAGALAGRPRNPRGGPGPIRLSAEPAAFEPLSGIVATADLVAALTWPGGPVFDEEPVRPLTAAETARFHRGRELYAATCASCHQESGLGEGGKAPALRHSPWVLGSEDRLTRILLHGMTGPLDLDGELWNMEMPALVAGDEDVAAILTYIRREWGHGVEPVSPETVRSIRAATAERGKPWAVHELTELE